MTQFQLARLLNVCAMTVSRWERGISPPKPYHLAFLRTFDAARKKGDYVGREAISLMHESGVVSALCYLFVTAGLEGIDQ